MTVLDLARMARPDSDAGAHSPPRLKAVASLHGILAPISPGTGGGDGAGLAADDAALAVPRVLVLHATADPFVPPEQVFVHFFYRFRRLSYTPGVSQATSVPLLIAQTSSVEHELHLPRQELKGSWNRAPLCFPPSPWSSRPTVTSERR